MVRDYKTNWRFLSETLHYLQQKLEANRRHLRMTTLSLMETKWRTSDPTKFILSREKHNLSLTTFTSKVLKFYWK